MTNSVPEVFEKMRSLFALLVLALLTAALPARAQAAENEAAPAVSVSDDDHEWVLDRIASALARLEEPDFREMEPIKVGIILRAYLHGRLAWRLNEATLTVLADRIDRLRGDTVVYLELEPTDGTLVLCTRDARKARLAVRFFPGAARPVRFAAASQAPKRKVRALGGR